MSLIQAVGDIFIILPVTHNIVEYTREPFVYHAGNVRVWDNAVITLRLGLAAALIEVDIEMITTLYQYGKVDQKPGVEDTLFSRSLQQEREIATKAYAESAFS